MRPKSRSMRRVPGLSLDLSVYWWRGFVVVGNRLMTHLQSQSDGLETVGIIPQAGTEQD